MTTTGIAPVWLVIKPKRQAVKVLATGRTLKLTLAADWRRTGSAPLTATIQVRVVGTKRRPPARHRHG